MMASNNGNSWREIKKARRQMNGLVFQAWLRAFFSGLGTGILVLGLTILLFSWMLWGGK